MGSSEDFVFYEAGYATACLDADEQRAQTDARVRGPGQSPWSGQESLGWYPVCEGGLGLEEEDSSSTMGEKTDKGGACLIRPHWLFVSNEDDIHNHNNGNSQQALVFINKMSHTNSVELYFLW